MVDLARQPSQMVRRPPQQTRVGSALSPMSAMLRRFQLACFIAFRILRSQRSATLSLVTIISIAATAVGVMSLTVVSGVTDGFKSAFQERILGLYPHMVVHQNTNVFGNYQEPLEKIRQAPGIVAATPVTFDDMMVAAGTKRSGAIIKGLDIRSAGKVIGLTALLRDGVTLDALAEKTTVLRHANRLVLKGVVAGTWLSVVSSKEGLTVLSDDRTPPTQGHCRVITLDLRGTTEGLALELQPRHGDDADSNSIELPTTRPNAYGAGQNVPAGNWQVAKVGGELTCESDTILTLVIKQVGDTTVFQSLVTRGRVPLRERVARVRVIRNDAQGTPWQLFQDEQLVVSDAQSGQGSVYGEAIGALPGIILGAALANKISAKRGLELTLVTPLRGIDNQMLGPYGMMPTSSRYRVVGVFESGFHDYDVRLAFVNIKSAQRFINRGDVIRWIEVKTENVLDLTAAKRNVRNSIDPYKLPTLVKSTREFEDHLAIVKGALNKESDASFLGPIKQQVNMLRMLKSQENNLGYWPRYKLVDWKEMNRNLFSALSLQQLILTLFFGIIVIVGSFVVVGSQIMVIHDKTADIAILKTMGTDSPTIRQIFTVQGMVVAVVGIALGLLLGVGICGIIGAVDYKLDASIYLIDRLPANVEPVELVYIGLVTLFCMFVAVQYSASRAVSKTPIEGLYAID
jgi:ABC-type lipoprotein release transport system permease subunit